MDSYLPSVARKRRERYINVLFQDGPLGERGENGCQIEDVLEVAAERLRELNVDPYRCRENSLAITAIEDAQNWLMRRTLERVGRQVEGQNIP